MLKHSNPLPSTRQRNDEYSTENGLWLRRQHAIDSRLAKLDIQNLDYVVHRYAFPGVRLFMLIEEKRFMAEPTFAQSDTFSILNQALWLANGQTITTRRNTRAKLLYYGLHLLQFERTCPDDGAIFWDRQEITVDVYLKLLRFEIHPSSISKKDGAA